MREVSASRFVRATPATLERALTPPTIVDYEGSFEVRESRETEDGWVVLAEGGGMTVELAFESLEDGFAYEQRSGPLETSVTTLRWHAENDGSRVRTDATLSMGLPLKAVTDRIAAWKRRGELRHALDRLAADVE
ncbi:polyketide cyclase [Halobacteriales archaeon QS_8_65_32]|jgi:hypothetical protein|nr:MAG: polyketide cyclase [Halobacteriales archaeon QS_8_65_32]